MFTFFEEFDIPLDKIIDTFIGFLIDKGDSFFTGVKFFLLAILNGVQGWLLFAPPWILIGLVFAAAWRLTGNWGRSLFLSFILAAIGFLGYWENAMITLTLVFTGVLFSLALGIPLGIAMAKSNRYAYINKPLLDAMQTMPSFVYLIPALMLFDMGMAPALLATIFYAMPPIIRLTNVGIRSVDREAVEAARAFGATPLQMLFWVQFPLAKPSIMVGINQTTMMALSMVVIGSMIGAKGLGRDVLLAVNRIKVGEGFEAGLCIVFLAIVIDRLTVSLAQKSDIPGSKVQRATR